MQDWVLMLAGAVTGWTLADVIKLRRRVRDLETQVTALWPKPTQRPIAEAEVRPAPRPYECPVCKTDDPYGYMRCNRPDCTDGRDPR